MLSDQTLAYSWVAPFVAKHNIRMDISIQIKYTILRYLILKSGLALGISRTATSAIVVGIGLVAITIDVRVCECGRTVDEDCLASDLFLTVGPVFISKSLLLEDLGAGNGMERHTFGRAIFIIEAAFQLICTRASAWLYQVVEGAYIVRDIADVNATDQ